MAPMCGTTPAGALLDLRAQSDRVRKRIGERVGVAQRKSVSVAIVDADSVTELCALVHWQRQWIAIGSCGLWQF